LNIRTISLYLERLQNYTECEKRLAFLGPFGITLLEVFNEIVINKFCFQCFGTIGFASGKVVWAVKNIPNSNPFKVFS